MPTAAEVGIAAPLNELYLWGGLFGPADMGANVTATLSDACETAMNSDGFQEFAAQTMGADEKTVFRTVILPFAFAGFAFCFVLSLNEYIIALMTAGFTVETLPIKIFNALRYGYTPVIASIAVVFLLINMLVFSRIAKFSNLSRVLGAMD